MCGIWVLAITDYRHIIEWTDAPVWRTQQIASIVPAATNSGLD
jgi:hypothetical protein